MTVTPSEVDPFDLPEWLVTDRVTWEPDIPLHGQPRVPGSLSGDEGHHLTCDLLATDAAHPLVVADDDTRAHAHRAWHHGQVHLGIVEKRLTVVVPGHRFTAEVVMEAVERLARALGADPERYAVLLRLGSRRSQ